MNFTPKILGQIVSNRRNQVVLGFYIGTIIYLIILLVNLTKGDSGLKVPEIAFLVGNALGVFNLALFVYFIHFISMEIQVKNIIRMIYFKTSNKIDALNKNELPKQDKEITALIEHHEWVTYLSADSGYLQNYAPELADYLREQDLLLKMELPMTRFVLKGNPIFSLNKKVEREIKEKIENYLFFYPDEVVEDNVLYGFRQIMEIAVKALSPGINDPGTANVCIEYLSSLCSKRSRLLDIEYACDKNGHIRIIAMPTRYEELLHVSFAPIRNYGSKDLSILERLMMSFKELSYQDKDEKLHKELYNQHVKAIIDAAEKSLVNEIDRQHFNNIIAHMNYPGNLYYTLPTLDADIR